MKIKNPTEQEIKEKARMLLETQIRERFTQDEEFRIINRGIADPADQEYLDYRATITELVEEYRNKVSKL
jgi:precorrin isomerase